MITNNGMKAYNCPFFENGSSGNLPFKQTNGTVNQPNLTSDYFYLNKAVTSRYSNGVRMVLGTGSTPVSGDDYKLDDDTYDGDSVENLIAIQSATKADANDGKIIYTFIFTNTSNKSIPIREIGLVTCTYNSYFYLIARAVVPERIVAPNETFTYSFTFGYN